MTALIIIRQPSKVFIASDLSVCDPADGKVIGFLPKVIAFPHISAAVGVRGFGLHIPLAQHVLAAYASSFERLKNDIVVACKEIVGLCAKLATLNGVWAIDVAIAGLDAEGRSDSFLVCSHDQYGPAFSRIDLGELALLPGDDKILSQVHSLPYEKTEDGSLDIDLYARRVMEIQRREPQRTLDGKMLCQVGGGISVTTISPRSITTRMIHRWSDEIGRPISIASNL